MFESKKQSKHLGFTKPGESSWYSGPAKRQGEKEKFKSKDEILSTPISERKADVSSDYYD